MTLVKWSFLYLRRHRKEKFASFCRICISMRMYMCIHTYVSVICNTKVVLKNSFPYYYYSSCIYFRGWGETLCRQISVTYLCTHVISENLCMYICMLYNCINAYSVLLFINKKHHVWLLYVNTNNPIKYTSINTSMYIMFHPQFS